MDKPERLLARDREWDLLCDFLADPAPAMRIAVVSGCRRHGKSFLLHALAEAADGLYLTAVREEGRAPALRRLSESPRMRDSRREASASTTGGHCCATPFRWSPGHDPPDIPC